MGSAASAAKGKVQAALNPKDLQAKAEVAGDALLHPQRSMYTMADVAVGSVKSATVGRDEAFRTGEELKARHRVARIAGPLSFEHTTCPQEQRALGVKTAQTNADNELLAEKRRQARVARNKVAPPTSLGLATSAPRLHAHPRETALFNCSRIRARSRMLPIAHAPLTRFRTRDLRVRTRELRRKIQHAMQEIQHAAEQNSDSAARTARTASHCFAERNLRLLAEEHRQGARSGDGEAAR